MSCPSWEATAAASRPPGVHNLRHAHPRNRHEELRLRLAWEQRVVRGELLAGALAKRVLHEFCKGRF